MRFLDANAMIGAHFAPREGKFFDAKDLLEEMDFYGIDEALVYHGLASDYDNDYGNRLLLDRLGGRPRLHSCWVVGVRAYGPPVSAESLVEEAIRHGVRSVRFLWGGPLPNVTVLDLDAHRELFTALERRRMPMILSNDASTDIGGDQLLQVGKVCKAFPELPIILFAPKLGKDSVTLYSLLDRCGNFHLVTSGIHGNGVLEAIARRFGVNHLIFGTNFPWFGSGQAKIALAYADLPETDKQAIASGNLARLREAVQ